jgi:hypothetical protein
LLTLRPTINDPVIIFKRERADDPSDPAISSPAIKLSSYQAIQLSSYPAMRETSKSASPEVHGQHQHQHQRHRSSAPATTTATTVVTAATTDIELQEQQPQPSTSTALKRVNLTVDGNSDDEDCISEMEKCSLQDSESCHCLWQMIRAAHGVFHWLNTLSCFRRRKRHSCEAHSAAKADQQSPLLTAAADTPGSQPLASALQPTADHAADQAADAVSKAEAHAEAVVQHRLSSIERATTR